MRRPADSAVTVPASTLTTSNVLQITWTAATPRAAQAGANAFAAAYLSYRHRELAGQVASLESVLSNQAATLEKQIAHLTTELSRTSSGRAPEPRHQAERADQPGEHS